MEFKEDLPVWEKEGAKPPKTKLEEGWQIGDRPPADWFNWLQNKTYRSLLELRQGSSELHDLINTKADKDDVKELIDNIPDVFHDAPQNSIKEDMNPVDFQHGLTLCSQSSTNSFPTIDDYGVTLTVRGANASYAQIFITRHGDVWARRSGVINEWNGEWYNAKREIDKKVDKVSGKRLSTNDYDNKEKKQVWINQGSISDNRDTGKVSTKHRHQVNVSYISTAKGLNSQVNTSSNSTASGIQSQVNSSYTSTASGFQSQVNASRDSEVSGTNWDNYGSNVIISGKAVKVDDTCGFGVVAGGGQTTSNEPSTQNRKWQLDGKGEIKASSSITGNSSFADFAEYMESSDGKSIPLGTIVALDEGQKIRVAREGDNPVGIISATAGIILNAQGFEWKDRYYYDRYGQPILVDHEVVDEDKVHKLYQEYLTTDGELSYDEFKDSLDKVPITTIKAPMLNIDYDPNKEYIPREDRDEWNVVGMKGQIYVNIDDTVEEHGYVKIGENGIATKGVIEVEYEGVKTYKLWQVMEITTPYQEDLGHGIARVII